MEMLLARCWYFFYFGGMACVWPYLNLLYRRNGLDDAQIGVLAAIKPWVSAPASFVWSGFADRFSIHKTILISTFVVSTLTRTSTAFAHSFTAFVVLAAAGEFVAAPVGVMADAAVVAACKRDTDYGKSRLWGAVAWGSLSSFSGWMVSKYGMNTGFAAYVLLSIPCVVCAWHMQFKLGQQQHQGHLEHQEEQRQQHKGNAAAVSIELFQQQQKKPQTADSVEEDEEQQLLVQTASERSAQEVEAGSPLLTNTHTSDSSILGPTASVNCSCTNQQLVVGQQQVYATPQQQQQGQQGHQGQQQVQPFGVDAESPDTCLLVATAPSSNTSSSNEKRNMHEDDAYPASGDTYQKQLASSLQSPTTSSNINSSSKQQAPQCCDQHGPSQSVPHQDAGFNNSSSHSSSQQLSRSKELSSKELSSSSSSSPPEGPKPPDKFWTSLVQLLWRPEVLIFMGQATTMGFGIGVIGEFLFLFLQELGGSETLMGLTLTMTCVAEVPVFHYQGTVLRYISVHTMLHVVMWTYVIRLGLYALLPYAGSPWAVLPVELLHGITFGCGWGAGTINSKRVAPPELAATMQGIFQGLYFGVGQGLGALIGGALKQHFGGQAMFLMCSAIVLLAWLVGLAAELATSGRAASGSNTCLDGTAVLPASDHYDQQHQGQQQQLQLTTECAEQQASIAAGSGWWRNWVQRLRKGSAPRSDAATALRRHRKHMMYMELHSKDSGPDLAAVA